MVNSNNSEIVVFENRNSIDNNRKTRNFNKLCDKLALKEIHIKRIHVLNDYESFRQNKDLWCLVHCAGIENLPATYVNNKIKKIEEYPLEKEINSWLAE